MLLHHQQKLVKKGILSQDQLDEARARAASSKDHSLLFALLERSDVDDEALLTTLEKLYKRKLFKLEDLPKPNASVLSLCSEKVCNELGFVPLGFKKGSLVVATADPVNLELLDTIRFRIDKPVVALFVRPDDIHKKIRELYDSDEGMDSFSNSDFGVADNADEQTSDTNLDDLKKAAEGSPIIKLVNSIIVKAMKMGSSDIHIEAGEQQSVVRLRVDGRLLPVMKFPLTAHALVVSRVKIISKLDISNSRTPQDGRSRIHLWGKNYDMRVSTLPSMYGEKVVIRILDKSGLSLDLDVLGFEASADQRVRESITRSTGMVLVTGPTGSGKTTTLYSFLHHINSTDANIITVEDPVEFQIQGINQVPVNAKAGLTFAAALRSILRQDPDIVMVGEIRDEETASIAVHAAQTGHLVLSTLHTNDAPSTISRLLEMGVDEASLSSSLNLIVAQRLLRRLCGHCKRLSTELPKALQALDVPDDLQWYEAVGCEKCHHIGYKGRLAVHEVLYVNDRVRESIASKAADHIILQIAREEGMLMLFEDALSKCMAGHTSFEEVARVSAAPEGFKLSARVVEGRLLNLMELNKIQQAKRAKVQASSGKNVIMVVDDSRSVRQLVRYVLASDGHEIIEAEDGQQAWELLQNTIPNLVISDCDMPNMNGWELIERIRGDARFDNIPVLMLTSHDNEEDEVRTLELGADDFITKPVEPMRLQIRVKKVLSMYDRIMLSKGVA